MSGIYVEILPEEIAVCPMFTEKNIPLILAEKARAHVVKGSYLNNKVAAYRKSLDQFISKNLDDGVHSLLLALAVNKLFVWDIRPS